MKKMFFIAIAIFLLTVVCYGASPTDQLADELGVDKLNSIVPQQALDFAEQNDISTPTPTSNEIISFSKLVTLAVERARNIMLEHKGQLLGVFASVLLSAVLATLGEETSAKGVFSLLCTLLITVTLCQPILSCLNTVALTIKTAAGFMIGYIPVFAVIIATNGFAATATVYHGALLGATQLISQLSGGFFLPLSQSYLMLSLAGAIGGNSGVEGLATAIKKLVCWGMVLVMSIFTAILSLQSLLTSATDGAAVKTTKFLLGSFVPIIGSVIGDALSAMQGGLGIIKAGVGGFGITVVILSFLPAIIEVSVLRGIIWCASFSCDILSAKELKGVLSAFGNTLSIVLAITISMLMLMVISTAVMLSLKGGG